MDTEALAVFGDVRKGIGIRQVLVLNTTQTPYIERRCLALAASRIPQTNRIETLMSAETPAAFVAISNFEVSDLDFSGILGKGLGARAARPVVQLMDFFKCRSILKRLRCACHYKPIHAK